MSRLVLLALLGLILMGCPKPVKVESFPLTPPQKVSQWPKPKT